MKDFSGVAEFLTAFNKLKSDIEACKGTPDQMYAGFILNAAEELYPTTREYLVNLPSAEQTQETFQTKFLAAEKLQQQQDKAQASFAGRAGSSSKWANSSGPSADGCHYVRQKAVRRWPAGHQCNGRHAPADCLAKKDDDWLKRYPDASPDDLPNWSREEGPWRRQQSPGRSARGRSPARSSSRQDKQSQSPKGRYKTKSGAMAVAEDDELDFGTVYSDEEIVDDVAGCVAEIGATNFFQCYPCKAQHQHTLIQHYASMGVSLVKHFTCQLHHLVHSLLHTSFSSASALACLASAMTSTPKQLYRHPNAPVLLMLDSGATRTCLNTGINLQPLNPHQRVNTAGEGPPILVTQTAEVPCPALGPGKTIRGYYSPSFRHNLLSIGDLQGQGIHISFSAHGRAAVCTDSRTGQITCTFQQGSSGLFECKLPAITPSACSTSGCTTSLLHQQLGHLSDGCLKTLINKKAITGLPEKYSAPSSTHPQGCTPCIQAKAKRVSHPANPSRAPHRLDLIHADLVGPFTPTSIRGYKYWLTIVDDNSRCGYTIPLQSKDMAKHEIITWTEMAQKDIKRPLVSFRCDRGSEFLNKTLFDYFTRNHIKTDLSNPYTPQQNGVAEARNRAVIQITRALLIQSGAPPSFWCHAAAHANRLANLMPHVMLQGITPVQVWTRVKPHLKKFKVWGCVGHVLLNEREQRASGGKLAAKTKACAYLGFNTEGPGYVLWDGISRKLVYSSNVIFQEHLSYFKESVTGLPADPMWATDSSDEPPEQPSPRAPAVAPLVPEAPAEIPVPAPAPEVLLPPAPAADQQQQEAPRFESPPRPPPPVSQQPRSSARLRGDSSGLQQLGRSILTPGKRAPRAELQGVDHSPTVTFADPVARVCEAPHSPLGKYSPVIYACLADISKGESGDKKKEIPTPTTWQEALKGEQSSEWLEGMQKEIQGLKTTGTFIEVPRSKANNVIKCKWVYRLKRQDLQQPIFKARLVAKGFSQKEGIDFFATFAPTAKQATARCILHLAACKDLEIHAMDVDQAFLQGELEETLFMEPAPGLTPKNPDFVWQLKRPLYGLKQAPRQWHAKLKGVLLEMGLKCSEHDPSLFIGTSSNNTWILVYVDDLLIMAEDTTGLQELKGKLKEKFPLKDLGPISTYLNMEISRNRDKKEIYLNQSQYIDSVLKKFADFPCKEVETPLPYNHNLTLPAEEEEAVPGQERYAELVGSLMYLMVCTRPDLAYPLSVLGRFVGEGRHGSKHWKAALRVLGYVAHTKHLRLTLGGEKSELEGFTDASWADHQDDRRSSQGYCMTLGSGMISWKATRSPAVALSTCEAELYGGTSAAQELLWLKRLLHELGYPSEKPVLWCDNKSTVAQTRDPVFSARSKHIEARYFFIRELTQGNEIKTEHIAGEINPADIFTKSLLKERHNSMLEMLGLK
jgi:hypothetical protein